MSSPAVRSLLWRFVVRVARWIRLIGDTRLRLSQRRLGRSDVYSSVRLTWLFCSPQLYRQLHKRMMRWTGYVKRRRCQGPSHPRQEICHVSKAQGLLRQVSSRRVWVGRLVLCWRVFGLSLPLSRWCHWVASGGCGAVFFSGMQDHGVPLRRPLPRICMYGFGIGLCICECLQLRGWLHQIIIIIIIVIIIIHLLLLQEYL